MPTYTSLELIDRLFARAQRKVRERFFEILEQIRTEHSLTSLAELIAARDFDAALSALDEAAGRLAAVPQAVFVGAGQGILDELGSKLGVVVSYDVTNVRAVQAMAENRLALIRGFTQQQQLATRQALSRGIQQGLNPRDQARAFRDSIGLTSKQEQWVANYARDLEELNPRALSRRLRDARSDSAVRRAIAEGRPLSASERDRLVRRYRERWIKHRSEVIARTESLRAVHQGTEEAIQQGIDAGTIDPEKTRRIWNTSRDERVRDFDDSSTSHRTMHLQERPVGVPFTSGAGNAIRFPTDPEAPPEDSIQCRCRVSTRVDL